MAQLLLETKALETVNGLVHASFIMKILCQLLEIGPPRGLTRKVYCEELVCFSSDFVEMKLTVKNACCLSTVLYMWLSCPSGEFPSHDHYMPIWHTGKVREIGNRHWNVVCCKHLYFFSLSFCGILSAVAWKENQSIWANISLYYGKGKFWSVFLMHSVW